MTTDEIAARLDLRYRAVATMLTEARGELTAVMAIQVAQWRNIWNANPLERVNQGIKRRADMVGVFFNEAAATRLSGAVLPEIHDEWQVASRRCLSKASDIEHRQRQRKE